MMMVQPFLHGRSNAKCYYKRHIVRSMTTVCNITWVHNAQLYPTVRLHQASTSRAVRVMDVGQDRPGMYGFLSLKMRCGLRCARSRSISAK